MPDSNGALLAGRGREATWEFDLGTGVTPWIGESAPDPRTLRSVRSPRSSSDHGHVPRWAFSLSVGGHLRLESALEHDLVRDLDVRSQVAWMIAQPARLRWSSQGSRRHSHVPDLLSLERDDTVTVWDVRPIDRQDERFKRAAHATAQACDRWGWHYEVFSGISTIRRTNLLWLDAYRRPMPWYPAALSIPALGGPSFLLRAAIDADGGHGHVLSAVWHALRNGTYFCDLDQRFAESTCVSKTAARNL